MQFTMLHVFIFFSLLFVGIVAYLAFSRVRRFTRDLELFSDVIRVLIRTGRVPPGVKFSISDVDQIWRKVLAFYSGISRNIKIKADSDIVISHALDLLKKDTSADQVLHTLASVLLKSCAPDALFVAIAEKSNLNNEWIVRAASGISCSRLEDPLTLAVQTLPLENDRSSIYTSSANGHVFDFSGLGVGVSAFVSMRDSQGVMRVLWIGFKNAVGLLDDKRRETIDLIITHALAMHAAATQSEERLEQSNSQKERILHLSHDLKSPSIRALYALREFKANNATINTDNSLLHEIEYALEEQLSLISELFSVGGSEATNQDSLSPVEFDIGAMIESRVDSFSILARSVHLDLICVSAVRAKVKMPKLIFNRVFDNLLSNAIKYTASGSIVVSTTLTHQRVEVSVEDTGEGVREDLVPHLFNSTMRTQSRLANSGHGYGLAVSKQLIEDWGGVIGYRPSASGGSNFFFSLPITSSISKPISENNAPLVLIVDDDVTVSKIHARWIGGIGVKTVVVPSFSEALATIALVRPTLIVSDINIPGENFYSFLSKLPVDVPVVLISADSQAYVTKGVEGFQNVRMVLEKPIQKEYILNTIKQIIYSHSKEVIHEKAA